MIPLPFHLSRPPARFFPLVPLPEPEPPDWDEADMEIMDRVIRGRLTKPMGECKKTGRSR